MMDALKLTLKRKTREIQDVIFRTIFGKRMRAMQSNFASLNQTVELFGIRLAVVETFMNQTVELFGIRLASVETFMNGAPDDAQAVIAAADDAQADIEARRVAAATKKIKAQIEFDPDTVDRLAARTNRLVERICNIEDLLVDDAVRFDCVFKRLVSVENRVGAEIDNMKAAGEALARRVEVALADIKRHD